MRHRARNAHRFATAVAAVAIAIGMLAGPAGAVTFTRLSTVNPSTGPSVAVTRTADGNLHLVYQTFQGRGFSGLASMTISPKGVPGPQVQALSGWQAGIPGLVGLPNGTLAAVFGGTSPGLVSSVWAITSADGGATWSAPVDVRSGGPLEAGVYAADVTATMSGSTPVLTLPVGGSIVAQVGLGPGSPTYRVNTSPSDAAAGGVDTAADAATGEVVASWQSLASPGGLFLQGAAPTLGAPQLVPGQMHNTLTIAGRDSGAGVFGAYSTDGTHVRLLRYGGGTVAVGSLGGVTTKVLGVATGLKGRMWVMWGDENGGIGVTRSNMAVTRFEPIQHLNPHAGGLYRLFGDGRLGPLDLIVDQIPSTSVTAGDYYARVLPVLSASTSVKKLKGKGGKVTGFKLTVRVTDAGDPVAGAKVSAKGHHATTDTQGRASLTLHGGTTGTVKMTVSAPGYQLLSAKVKL
jgi:hypothetical protein